MKRFLYPALLLPLLFLPAPVPAEESSLLVLVTPRSLPFSSLDEEGRVQGFNVDVAQAICRELKRVCRFETRRFPEIIPELAEGRAALGLANFLKTPERARLVGFSVPYWRSSSIFVGRAGASLEVARRCTCVIAGSVQQAWLTVPERGHGVELIPLDSNQAVLDTLQRGGCSAALLPLMQAFPFLQTEVGKGFGFLGTPIAEDGLGGSVHIAVRQGDKALLEAVDRAILRMIASGEHEALARRYFPFSIL